MEECNMCYEKVTVIKSICEQMDHSICTKCASQIYSTRHKLFCEYCQKQFNDNNDYKQFSLYVDSSSLALRRGNMLTVSQEYDWLPRLYGPTIRLVTEAVLDLDVVDFDFD